MEYNEGRPGRQVGRCRIEGGEVEEVSFLFSSFSDGGKGWGNNMLALVLGMI